MTKGITRARRDEVDERVSHIEGLMRDLAWVRGKSNRELSVTWGCSVDAVNDYAAEAGRRLRSEVTDASEVTATVATTLRANLERASIEREYKAVASLADVWTKIVGAQKKGEPPEPAMPVDMSPERMVTYLDERIAKLTELRTRLLERMGVVQALPAPADPE